MNKELINSAGKSGVILGLIGSIFTLLYYLLMEAIFSSPSSLIGWLVLIFALSIGFTVYLGKRWRTSLGGFVSYKSSFLFLFFMLVMSGIINLGFEVVLYNVIEPDLQKQTGELVASMLEDFLYDMDLPDDQIEEAVEDSRKNAQNLSVTERLMTFRWRLVLNVFLALILALFVRKEKPIFD